MKGGLVVVLLLLASVVAVSYKDLQRYMRMRAM